jgi:Tfp pilus assembly protein PilV
VETFVAVTILIFAIVGPMTIAARGMQSAFFARERLTAVYLAQEGIELVRERRDEAALNGQSWLANFPGACFSGSGCGIDTRNNTRTCSSQSCTLNYDTNALGSNRGIYTYGAGDTTIFTRVITVDETTADQEALVTVTVSWQSNLFSATQSVTSQLYMANQYDNI